VLTRAAQAHRGKSRRRSFSAILREKDWPQSGLARQRWRVNRRAPQGASHQGEEVRDAGGWQRSRPNAIREADVFP